MIKNKKKQLLNLLSQDVKSQIDASLNRAIQPTSKEELSVA